MILKERKSSYVGSRDIYIKPVSKQAERYRKYKYKTSTHIKDYGASHIFETVEWVKITVMISKRKFMVQFFSRSMFLAKVTLPIWKSFITQDPHDQDLLVKNLKPFDILVLNYTGNRQIQNKPLPVSDAMGITSRLDEVFEAPSVVKEVLISQAALEHLFIGSEETNRRVDDANKLGVMVL